MLRTRPQHCAQIAFVADRSRAPASAIDGSNRAEPTNSCTAVADSCLYDPAGDADTTPAAHIACACAAVAVSITAENR